VYKNGLNLFTPDKLTLEREKYLNPNKCVSSLQRLLDTVLLSLHEHWLAFGWRKRMTEKVCRDG
jgi:hypothetical protein